MVISADVFAIRSSTYRALDDVRREGSPSPHATECVELTKEVTTSS